MSHSRKLVFGGVSLVNQRMPKNIGLLLDDIRNEIEKVFIASDFLSTAPFTYVGIIFRFGMKDDPVPEIKRVNKKHGDLPVGAEVDVTEFLKAAPEIQRQMIRKWALQSLIPVAEKFGLPKAPLMEYAEQKSVPID